MIQLKNYMTGCTFPDGGSKLFTDLDSILSSGNQVDIDLEGVLALPSMFMSASFGQAVQKYGIEVVRHNVRFLHVTRGQAERIKEYFSRFQNIAQA